MIHLRLFYFCLCLYCLLSSQNVLCWRVLKYAEIDKLAPVTTIPDPKWHFFEVFFEWDRFVATLTPSVPVLRYCTFDEIFRIFIKKGQPPFELLLFLQHAKGDHLVNLTFAANGNIYVNKKFWYKCYEFLLPVDRTELFLRRQEGGWALWSRIDRKGFIPIGNGPIEEPIIPWVHTLVNGYRCYEVKVKVVVGYIEYTVLREFNAWPTESYDDVFFETTTTITSTTAIDTTNVPEKDKNHQEDETTQHSTVNKASAMVGLIYAVCGILVLIAAALLFFLGFRLGRCFARKQAMKKGLLKSGAKESNASEPGSGDTGPITPDASTNPVESTKTPTKAGANTPTTKTNTEKNPAHAESAKPRTATTPTTKNEVESSVVPTESLVMSNRSNKTA